MWWIIRYIGSPFVYMQKYNMEMPRIASDNIQSKTNPLEEFVKCYLTSQYKNVQ